MRDFSPIATSRRRRGTRTPSGSRAGRLAEAIESSAWDGAWYRRAFFDDGSPLGSESNVECRIDAIAQSWSVIAGAGDATRARSAVAQAEAQLIKADPPMMLLLTPPFDGKGQTRATFAHIRRAFAKNGGQ